MSRELDLESLRHGKELVKRGFARMQKGGVIMDVVNAEQAKIAEDAGAVAVMALERVPSDIRADGGVARMSNPNMISEIIDCTSIPIMAKCRIGHTAEARVLEELGVDMIDESEVLTPADPYYHVVKDDFTVPFGKARIWREGTDATIVSFGIGMQYALAAADKLEVDGISVEVIDLRTLRPMDTGAIINSVMKTNRLVTVEEGWPQGSVGSYISSVIMQEAFDYLDAPVINCTGKDVPMPYAANLEKHALLTTDEVVDAVKKVTYR